MASPTPHYLFAHRALPFRLFFGNSPADAGETMKMLFSPTRDNLLRGVFRECAKEASLPHLADLATTIQAWPVRADALHVGVLVQPPAPTAIAEAFFVALTVRWDASGAISNPRYFTLEKSIDIMTQAPATQLCGWTADGKHLNLGPGPAVDAQAFFAAITPLVIKAQ